MADDRSLPGWPKKKLVKAVRRHLSTYGIRPNRSKIWQATWVWAEAIARSYFQTHWPLPSEIGDTIYPAAPVGNEEERHVEVGVSGQRGHSGGGSGNAACPNRQPAGDRKHAAPPQAANSPADV